jgi:multifunctional beta-oxidation protein
VGFTKTIAREGAKYGIVVNAVAPNAGTNMTRTVRPESEVQMLKPEYVAPLVAALCSENPPASGQLYEAGSGWFAATRWQRARGVDFELEKGIPLAEDVAKVCDNYFRISLPLNPTGMEAHIPQAFAKICDFDDGQADNPEAPSEGSKYTMGNVMKSEKMVSPASLDS